MSGPHGTAEPPSILIAWSDELGQWRATAVLADFADQVEGQTSSLGRHPADALQALLERRFGCLCDSACPPTLLDVAMKEPGQ